VHIRRAITSRTVGPAPQSAGDHKLMLDMPAELKQTILELYGSDGAAWLQSLPGLITHCEQRWSLRVLPPFPGLSYNFVAPALRADGTQVILKLGVPNPELLTEIDALRLFDGRGAAHLLESDAERGVLLLERLSPGTMLSSLDDDDQATSIAAAVMQQLWRPLPAEHAFPSTAKWADGLKRLRANFDGGCGPFPPTLVETAEALFTDLFASMNSPVLLHGDLHHFNILRAERAPWLAIDPKGVTGEPAYDVGALLRNPAPSLLQQPDPARILARRVDLLSEQLGFDRTRILMWGTAQAVLSAWSNFEDQMCTASVFTDPSAGNLTNLRIFLLSLVSI